MTLRGITMGTEHEKRVENLLLLIVGLIGTAMLFAGGYLVFVR